MAVENPFSAVVKVLYLQALVGISAIALSLWVGGKYYGFSALMGLIIAIIPNAFFAFKIYLVRQ